MSEAIRVFSEQEHAQAKELLRQLITTSQSPEICAIVAESITCFEEEQKLVSQLKAVHARLAALNQRMEAQTRQLRRECAELRKQDEQNQKKLIGAGLKPCLN